jgi:two-component system response regulator YesN
MYRILIVDDEEIVREGIEHTIEWSELGFEFSGSFTNGTEAAEAVERVRPAAVITDICMPFCDGLDLTELIVHRYPRTKVILLSGFDEFEYAQRAVKLGAYDYVLKPITAEELRALLRKLRSVLDQEAENAAKLRRISEKLTDSYKDRIHRITERLVEIGRQNDSSGAEELLGVLKDSGRPIPDNGGVVVAAQADPSMSEAIRSVAMLSSNLQSLLTVGPFSRSQSTVFEDHAGRAVIIRSYFSPERPLTGVREFAARVRSTISQASGHPVTVGIGCPFIGPEGLADSYRRAVQAIEFRFIAGGGRVIAHDDIAHALRPDDDPSSGEWSPPFRAAVASLERSVRSCDAREMTVVLERIRNEMRSGFVSRSNSLLQIHAILVHINDIREQIGEKPVSTTEFSRAPTLDQALAGLREICRSLIEAQTRAGETYAGSKSAEATEIIEQDYADPRLTLTVLCARIGVSPSYFSSIFKAHTGKTFVEYLTLTRVGRAKYLLKTTDLKSYEIADRIGYEDQRYFCTIFKKATGRSPMEFRREALRAGVPGNA